MRVLDLEPKLWNIRCLLWTLDSIKKKHGGQDAVAVLKEKVQKGDSAWLAAHVESTYLLEATGNALEEWLCR